MSTEVGIQINHRFFTIEYLVWCINSTVTSLTVFVVVNKIDVSNKFEIFVWQLWLLASTFLLGWMIIMLNVIQIEILLSNLD